MHKGLEQQLVEHWPTWFNTGGDIRHTAMPRGFTHDDGKKKMILAELNPS
jgi:hypothetical protein